MALHNAAVQVVKIVMFKYGKNTENNYTQRPRLHDGLADLLTS